MLRYSGSNDVFASEQKVNQQISLLQAPEFISVPKPHDCANCGSHRGLICGQREGEVKT